MKILMLTPYLPYPPSSGGQVRSYNLIKHLSHRHQIYLVSLIKHDDEKQFIRHLRRYCSEIFVCKRSESPWIPTNIIKSIIGPYPFLVVRNFSKEARDVVTELLKKIDFDLIHAETFYIMPHIPQTKTPILLAEQTIEYRVYQHFVRNLQYPFLRPFFYFDIVKLKYWEKTFWKRASLVSAVSKEDKNKMRKLLPNLRIEIIPNAAGEDLLELYQYKKRGIQPVFLYQGNFAWLQNIEAAEILAYRIFPQIRKRLPGAVCFIAGQRAQEKIGHLAKSGVQIVNIRSSETDTVKDMYRQSSIFLAPIKGPGGTRLKILGAMAAGLPVISSPTGVSGLDVREWENVLIAKSEHEFAQHAVTITENKLLYEKIRKNARRLIEDKYNWARVSHKLETIYRKLKKN